MPATTVIFRTPYYVLLDGLYRIGPEIVQSNLDNECLAIFGFSDKDAYDRFNGHDDRALAPYPLVKGYLQVQLRAPVARLNLVVIDAAGPVETLMNAATMEAVLQAQEDRTPHLSAAYRLTFDKAVGAYRVEFDLG